METLTNSRLRTLRESLKISQRNMATILSVSPSYYSDIENSRRPLTDKFITKVEKACNASRVWIKTGEGEMFTTKSVESVLKKGLNETFNLSKIDLISHEMSFRLDNYFKNNKDLEDIYNDAMEIAMFSHEYKNFQEKYLSVFVHSSVDDREYLIKNINVLYEQMKKLKKFKKAVKILADAIRSFNSEMYDAGDNDFAITQIHRLMPSKNKVQS